MLKKFIVFSLSLFISLNLSAQLFSLSGEIQDAETGEPIIGASVLAGTNGVVTDIDGNYLLKIPNGDHKVSISYVGYDDQVLDVTINGADQVLNVKLGSGVF